MSAASCMPCATASSGRARERRSATRQAIQAWWQERWPALEKKRAAEGRTIVWVDQSGFYLLPMAVRTWAPCGQTPRAHVPLTHDHLSAIGGITAPGRLFLQTQERAYHSEDVVGFLRVLLRKIRGKLLVIWDGAPFIAASPSRTSCAGERPSASTSSNSLAMRRTSTPPRGSGTISNGSSWPTTAARPRHPAAGAAPCQRAAPPQTQRPPGLFTRPATRFSLSCKDQKPSENPHQAGSGIRYAGHGFRSALYL